MASNPLSVFKPEHAFFVGIDSDGCVFDSMEIKHKECFIPTTIKQWKLQAVSKFAREAAEYVNLYSKGRGINRWPALLQVLELLEERPEVRARGVSSKGAIEALRAFLASGKPQSNEGLQDYMHTNHAHELRTAMVWSHAVNAAIHELVHGVPPFPLVRECLAKARQNADLLVVSQTPGAALEKEWAEHDIAKFVRLIAGQELGTKSEHLKLATESKYEKSKVLMLGDAPGDLKAARSTGALFFPIIPGDEEASWKRLHDEALDKFFAGTYAGAYEAKLVEAFDASLPAQPPWKR